ncbi:hypothetical protein C0Q70_06251 [Pomacea canaliculata]|uniref:Uncharacterized protein n=1 Tax=Pomacea canaliculata TaxID=400727 RepID=A0A2T7PNG7_POMCA|nr:hypothetical protein C0Q70_06251 [Pomacea canaliculata]
MIPGVAAGNGGAFPSGAGALQESSTCGQCFRRRGCGQVQGPGDRRQNYQSHSFPRSSGSAFCAVDAERPLSLTQGVSSQVEAGGQQDLQEVERVRTLFPETWLWTSASAGIYSSISYCTVNNGHRLLMFSQADAPVYEILALPMMAAGSGAGGVSPGTGALQEVERVREVFPETWLWANARTSLASQAFSSGVKCGTAGPAGGGASEAFVPRNMAVDQFLYWVLSRFHVLTRSKPLFYRRMSNVRILDTGHGFASWNGCWFWTGSGSVISSDKDALQEVERVRDVFPETWLWANARTRSHSPSETKGFDDVATVNVRGTRASGTEF